MTKSDTELVALAREGDKDAFAELVARYQPMAFRIAARMLADDQTSQDVTQEAIIQAYQSLSRLRSAERFQSWLHGIVLNVCRRHLRGRNRVEELSHFPGAREFDALPYGDVEPGPEEEAEARELRRLVHRVVERLSPKNRSATRLFYYDGLSIQEVAERLGISTAATKVRLHRSRSQLRELLLPHVVEVFRPSLHDSQRPRTSLKGVMAMAQVVNSLLATCPSCPVQALIRSWSCGCQGVDYPEHLNGCKAPDDYFIAYVRHCQELDEHGKNPQIHLKVVSEPRNS